jgi:hypothetical protein
LLSPLLTCSTPLGLSEQSRDPRLLLDTLPPSQLRASLVRLAGLITLTKKQQKALPNQAISLYYY